MPNSIAPMVNPESKQKGPNVGYIRSEVSVMQAKWTKIEDCLIGEDRVKSKLTAYLPMPNAADQSPDNQERYAAYINRAVFYNVTKKTLDGLIGQVFCRDPLVAIPDGLNPMIDNVDGEGVTLDQQAKKGLALCMAKSGFGLLVDYPKTEGPISVAQMRDGFIYPTFIQYAREDVINWRSKKVGARNVYSLVVTKEKAPVSDDGFEVTSDNRWRVLQLDAEGDYTATVYRQDEETDNYLIVDGPHKVLMADGTPWKEIPFEFCGPLDNDSNIDEPMLADLAGLNIAHYRNSADYEDSCYMVGQPTPYFGGLTEQWVKKVFQNKTITLGSRAAIPLPAGGTAGLLQAKENSMPYEAMRHKEAQMVAMGAKLITPGSGKNTLGEAQLEESGESSVLGTAAKNVSIAYTRQLKRAAKFQGVTDKDIFYSLNTDFPAARLTPNERTQTVLEWQAGAIAETEMRATLRKAGVATLDIDEYRKELKDHPAPQPQQMTNNGGQGGANNDPKQNKDTNNNGGNQSGV